MEANDTVNGSEENNVRLDKAASLFKALRHNTRINAFLALKALDEPITLTDLHKIVDDSMTYKCFTDHVDRLLRAGLVKQQSDPPPGESRGHKKFISFQPGKEADALFECISALQS